MRRTQIWMSGGGTQSAAIAALIVQGRIAPPDLAVIVDTEREKSTTWAYHDAVIAPALASVGVTLHRVAKSKYATVDVFGGADKQSILIPAFTTQGGDIGKLPGYCSGEWKRDVAHRWATKEHGVTAATNWIGYSTDELKRAGKLVASKKSKGKWRVCFPLIEQKLNRWDCVLLVERMGWPTPPRSSCWMCPNQLPHEWRDTRDNSPGDFRKAITFDRWIRTKDPHAYVHEDAVPLDKANLDDANSSIFERCESGVCFV